MADKTPVRANDKSAPIPADSCVVPGRRRFLATTLAFGGLTFALPSLGPANAQGSTRFGFENVAANTLDEVTVPQGYSARVMARWGDPMWSDVAAFSPDSRRSAKTQGKSLGDKFDGAEVIVHDGRTLLITNNESTNLDVIWANRRGKKPKKDDLRRAMVAHGVSVVEIAQDQGRWRVVQDSPYNRRLTPKTPIALTGEAAGHDLMKTPADPTGRMVEGTWSNCGLNMTPWGTCLTCEENFQAYFSASKSGYKLSKSEKRYGLTTRHKRSNWARIDRRFDLSRSENEPNRAGYVVEFDPRDPTSLPKKRTSLGRFSHENAEVVVSEDGHVVVYMGDDRKGEYLYRYVSEGIYGPGADTDDLLDNGSLWVARFDDDGTGKWLRLTPKTTGMDSMAQICVYTRMAASAVKATTMDRPEWIAAHPERAELYCALTKNSGRGRRRNDGGDKMPVDGPNPRKNNKYGQIVRWRPRRGDHTSSRFTWDLFAIAGNPAIYDDARAGSDNITPETMFNGPDGLRFDSTGLLWILTDGNTSDAGDFAGHGHNQMLAADPETGELRRFLVAPRDAEVTGLCWSPDRRTMFVAMQNPDPTGNWPDGGDTLARSAIMAVTRDDGEILG